MKLTKVTGLAPLLFRDGRPFTADSDESRARGPLLPPPSVVAGLIRTAHGTEQGWDWSRPGVPEQARGISIGFHGLRVCRGDTTTFLLPAPADAVVHRDGETLRTAKLTPLTLADGEGSDLPPGLALLADDSTGKPEPGHDLWAWPDVLNWLKGHVVVPAVQPHPPVDERVQVAIDPTRRAVAEGMLFTVEFRAWEHGSSTEDLIQFELVVDASEHPTGIAHLGGETRPVVLSPSEGDLPQPDAELWEALTRATTLRCVLTTPAVFTNGWRPQWLLSDSPLAAAGPRLVAAAVGAPMALSGWDHETRGPKPARRLAPAGSVHFIQLDRPLSHDELSSLWLSSISDNEQDRRDGFGVALWGV
ncbi:type III-B CRISPR module-associated protein Cmr3 [Arachnia propionica]|uniref:Type III-B CRISPR module-associated protein Cmr3 n=1 Tax=Arachnia propionica TaxID=1750 RepID=A0A3P1T4U7_9ACTN|nr:type III-B CRISPR module-associated Cmr3 family protein [Arachnia propionica]RRD04532.1 type III-B CRISPR module-associated protein Cmr3 [Arachnia propionica]